MRTYGKGGIQQEGNQIDKKRIILKRNILSNRKRFTDVLLNELAHARSGATDATRIFEDELTNMLGEIGLKAIDSNGKGRKGFISKLFN